MTHTCANALLTAVHGVQNREVLCERKNKNKNFQHSAINTISDDQISLTKKQIGHSHVSLFASVLLSEYLGASLFSVINRSTFASSHCTAVCEVLFP